MTEEGSMGSVEAEGRTAEGLPLKRLGRGGVLTSDAASKDVSLKQAGEKG